MNKKQIFFVCFCFVVLLWYSCSYLNIYMHEMKEKEAIHYILHKEDKDSVEISVDGNIDNKSGKIGKEIDVDNKSNNVSQSYNDKNQEAYIPEGMDCVISIPCIDLEKIVYTGTDREKHLQKYELITATPDMKYFNKGNYIICGHASRLYGHSLNRLREIKVGDKVYIRYYNSLKENISEEYIVESVTYEVMNDTSKYCKQTEEQVVTIISCAKYIAPNNYIVIKCKK